MIRKTILMLTASSLVAVSGIALAQTGPEDDTVLNYGYDEESQAFLWNITPNDGLHDCSLAGAPVKATYGVSPDGLVHVDGLTDLADVVVSFPARPQADLADGLIEADGPVEYTNADGECGVAGGLVAGPNGQINHGMFMKLFNSLYQGQGRGCVNRYIAQSGLGKGDQHVRVGDVDPTQALATGDVGVLEFATEAADCQHGKADEEHGPTSKAHPDHTNNQKPKTDKPHGKPDTPSGSDD